jgi:hypothetical protein
MQMTGLCRDLAYFDARVSLNDLPIIPVGPDERLPVSEQKYSIHGPLDTVFDAYRCAEPHEMWPRDRITFRFCTLPGSDKRHGPEGEIPPIEEGMKVFCDLKVKPLDRYLAIMVGVAVTRVETNREIRYDYLEGSVTRGFNSMRFHEETNDRGERVTHIHHYSEYQATSRRLQLFFPIMQPLLHVGFVNALHHGMKERIESVGDS